MLIPPESAIWPGSAARARAIGSRVGPHPGRGAARLLVARRTGGYPPLFLAPVGTSLISGGIITGTRARLKIVSWGKPCGKPS